MIGRAQRCHHTIGGASVGLVVQTSVPRGRQHHRHCITQMQHHRSTPSHTRVKGVYLHPVLHQVHSATAHHRYLRGNLEMRDQLRHHWAEVQMVP